LSCYLKGVRSPPYRSRGLMKALFAILPRVNRFDWSASRGYLPKTNSGVQPSNYTGLIKTHSVLMRIAEQELASAG